MMDKFLAYYWDNLGACSLSVLGLRYDIMDFHRYTILVVIIEAAQKVNWEKHLLSVWTTIVATFIAKLIAQWGTPS